MIANPPQVIRDRRRRWIAPSGGMRNQRHRTPRAPFFAACASSLDEPNSNFDTNGDKALAKVIKHAQANRLPSSLGSRRNRRSSKFGADKVMPLADGNHLR
jgi:ATP-binding cassette subfamily C protein